MNLPAYPTATSKSRPGIRAMMRRPRCVGSARGNDRVELAAVAIGISMWFKKWTPMRDVRASSPLHGGQDVEAHQQDNEKSECDGVCVEGKAAPGSVEF